MKNKNTYLIGGIIIVIIIAIIAFFWMRSGKEENLGIPGKPKVTDISSASSTFPALALAANGNTATSSLYAVLGNLVYGVKEDAKTKLTNGYYLGRFEDCGGVSCLGVTYYSHMRLEPAIIEGDLNHDGVKDAVVVVSSGTTASPDIRDVPYTKEVVAALVNKDGTYSNVAAIELTDDVQAKTVSVTDIKIKNDVIYVTVLKNQMTPSQSSETVQLTLDPTSASGYKLVRTKK